MFLLLLLLACLWLGYAAFGRRWRVAPLLEEPAAAAASTRSVLAVVPARNEAAELPHTLPALLAQTHRALRVVLVDDHSEDGTADVARQVAAAAGAAERLFVLDAPELPVGWTGKVWAQHQGVQRALDLGAEWIWFTDADIRHDVEVLARLLATADRWQRDFVSVMARLRCQTGVEKLLIPAFTYFFAGLYSFESIADDRSPAAGAAGGCMLVRAAVLQRAGGMAAIRDAVIDDVSLARACKQAGARLWLGYDQGVNSSRGYGTLGAIWDMVARSAYTQLRFNPVALVGCVVGLAWLFVLPVWAALTASGVMRLLGVLAYAGMIRTYLPMVGYLGCRPAWAFALPVAAALYAGMTLSSAWRHYAGAGAAWKGRAYHRPRGDGGSTRPTT
jgi:hopene-associated glycosyltransferase HpnB